MKRRHLAAMCLLFAATAAGCGSLEASICDKRIACEGGNDRDRNACIDRYRGQTQIAAAYDCSDAWAKALGCLDTSGVCMSARFTSGCDVQFEAAEACVEAAAAPNFR